jgi:hypothetical protein
MVPTAQEFFDSMLENNEECTSVEMLIRFAKLHLVAQQLTIVENAKLELDKDWITKTETIYPNQLISSVTIKVNADSILNAYPLKNVK